MVNDVLNNISNLGEFVDKVAENYRETVAFEIRRRVKKEQILYSQLPSLTNKVNLLLQSKGLEQKDKVMICGLNCPEYSMLLLTLFSKGYVTVPIDYRTSEEVISKIIDETQPKIALISRFIDGKVFLQKTGSLLYIEDLFEDIRILDSQKLQVNKSVEYIDPAAMCEIVYTSGTTGVPKGVLISQDNIITNIRNTYKRLPRLQQYRTISILPLSHMLEQIIGLFLSLSYGSKVTYLPRINSLKLKEAMLEVKPTYMVFVPQMLSLFWQRIELEAQRTGKQPVLIKMLKMAGHVPFPLRKYLFGQIHKTFGGELAYIGCGGAPLNYDVCRNFINMGFNVLEGYGATEVTAVATFNSDYKRLGCAGKPLEGVEIKTDESGQILIKSPSVSLGYFNKAEKTKEVFVDGWYKTGDIGILNRSGEVCVTGRDAFKIVLASGEKVYVEDMEKKVLTNSKIKDCCVLGIQEKDADRIHAVFILKNKDDEGRMSEIVREINLTLESKQQILDYSIWYNEEFPRTYTLKVDRAKIRTIVLQNIQNTEHVEEGQRFETVAQADILDILSRISGISKSKIVDTDLLGSDLNIDSLDRGELVSSIEENLGVSVDILKLTSSSTVNDLKQLLSQSQSIENKVRFPVWQFTAINELLRTVLLYALVYPIHAFFVKLRIEYKGGCKIPPGSILVFNHAGLLDVLCIFRLLGRNSAKIISLAAADFWGNKIFSKILELFGGGLPLDQSGRSLIPMLQVISDLIPSRYLLLAPQGRLQRSLVQDRFKAGVGFFASELSVPIIPIKLIGYEDVWPAPSKAVKEMSFKEIFPKKIGEVKIKVGVPLVPTKDSDYAEIANRLEEELAKL